MDRQAAVSALRQLAASLFSQGPHAHRARMYSLGLLALVAYAVRLVSALQMDTPSANSSYYMLLARSILGGGGFSVPVVWSHIDLPTWPDAGNVYFMPLAALAMLPFGLLFGDHALAYRQAGLAAGAGTAVLTVLLASRLGLGWWRSLMAGLLYALAGFAVLQSADTDSSVFFALTITAALVMLRGPEHTRRTDLVAGLLFGLAYLARSEAVLAAIALGVVLLIARRPRRLRVIATGMLPLVLLWQVVGLITAPGRQLHLALGLLANRSPQDLARYPYEPQLQGPLDGWDVRLEALGVVFTSVLPLLQFTLLAPLVIGAVALAALPWSYKVFVGLFAGLQLVLAVLVFPAATLGGFFLHTSAALVPLGMIALAALRFGWLGTSVLIGVQALTLAWFISTGASANPARSAALASLGADMRTNNVSAVLTNIPTQLAFVTRIPAVVLPPNIADPQLLCEVAVRHRANAVVVLGKSYPMPFLSEADEKQRQSLPGDLLAFGFRCGQ